MLHDGCLSLSNDDLNKPENDRNMYKYIISDDANRMLFCDVPKAGSTFVKTLWLNFTQDVQLGRNIHLIAALRRHNLRYLNTYNASEIQIRLKSYFKFMVARHPLVRLLSGYRDKLEVWDAMFEFKVGRFIKQLHFSANQSKRARVTFEEFVHYLVNKSPVDYNFHWRPFTLLCQPCEIHYDYIVKLETSHVDYPYIFSKLKNMTDSKRRILKSMKAHKTTTDLESIKKYYDRIPAPYMNTLETIYRFDLNLFGYTWNQTSLSYGCRVKTEGKECC